MKSMFTAASLGLINQVLADTLVLPPPASATGEDVAIVWIHGMQCDNEGYTAMAAEVQSQGVGKDQKIWVGLP